MLKRLESVFKAKKNSWKWVKIKVQICRSWEIFENFQVLFYVDLNDADDESYDRWRPKVSIISISEEICKFPVLP